MQTRHALVWVSTVVVLLASAACGSSDSPSAEQSEVSQIPVPTVTQTSPAAKPAAGPSASDYFELLATNDSENAARAAKLAAPKSLAAYATHLAAVHGADEDGGDAGEADELTVDGDTYRSCAAGEDSDDCTRWSGVTFKDGRIASLTVNEKGLSGRLALGSDDKVAAGKLGEGEARERLQVPRL